MFGSDGEHGLWRICRKQRGLWQKRPKEKVLTQCYWWLQCQLLEPRLFAFWDPQLPGVSSRAVLPLSQFSREKFVWSKWECAKAELYMQHIWQPGGCKLTGRGRITNCCIRYLLPETNCGDYRNRGREGFSHRWNMSHRPGAAKLPEV